MMSSLLYFFFAEVQLYVERSFAAKRLSEIVQNEWAAPLNVKMQRDRMQKSQFCHFLIHRCTDCEAFLLWYQSHTLYWRH